MKKLVQKIMMFSCLFLLTGCMKMNSTMDITTDNVKITTIIAVKEEYRDEFTDEFDKDELKKNGYQLEEYNEDGYVGYKLIKSLGKLSSLKGAEKHGIVNLYDYVNGEKTKNKKLFYSLFGFYSARFMINEEDTLSEDDLTSSNDLDDVDLSSVLESKFIVNLPTSALENNATEVSNDNKTLTWDLTKTNEIKFKFCPYLNIYIIIGSILGILVILSIISTLFDVIRRKIKGATGKNRFIIQK